MHRESTYENINLKRKVMLQIDILNKSELNRTMITAFMKANDEESELTSILESTGLKEAYGAVVEDHIVGLIIS